jgi:hypothetical protein
VVPNLRFIGLCDHGTLRWVWFCLTTPLKEYQEPKLDQAKNEELLEYIARREREIPAADALNTEY